LILSFVCSVIESCIKLVAPGTCHIADLLTLHQALSLGPELELEPTTNNRSRFRLHVAAVVVRGAKSKKKKKEAHFMAIERTNPTRTQQVQDM